MLKKKVLLNINYLNSLELNKVKNEIRFCDDIREKISRMKRQLKELKERKMEKLDKKLGFK